MLKIEIDAQDAVLVPRVIKGKEGAQDRTVYSQKAYIYTGSRYPKEVELPMEDGVPAYPAGMYTYHCSSYQPSRFNKVELHPFKTVLMPWADAIKALTEDKKVA